MRRHIIEKHGKRQLRDKVFIELSQFGLPRRKIIRRSRHDTRRTAVRSDLSHADTFDNGGVGDAYQHGQTAVVDAAGLANHLVAQVVAQALLLTRRAQDEQSVHASCDEVFDQTFQTFHIQRVIVFQRGHQRRDNAAHRTFQ